uniref:Methyl-CpG binding domain protein 2 n=1 Tax=Strigops habroptila TaxID=2489341 RepID=A0A672UFT7_STRHB
LINYCTSLRIGKPDLNTTLPIRQTASIFKQPVTKVTNHPSNKVRSDPQRVTEQPRQVRIHLFPFLLLRSLKQAEKVLVFGSYCGCNNDDTLLSAVASALHTSSAPITGQVSAAVEKNPAVWLNTSQPLCKAFIVTDDDIRERFLVALTRCHKCGETWDTILSSNFILVLLGMNDRLG